MTQKQKQKEEKGQEQRIYVTEAEAAEYLRVAERTLRFWRQTGRVDKKGTRPPKYYIRGRHIYDELHELDEWVRQGATNCSDEEPRRRRGAH